MIYLIDGSDPLRFDEAKEVLDDLLQEPDLDQKQILILLNK